MSSTTSENFISIMVGMGEVHVSIDPNSVLACLGIGSCVALCAYDPISRVGAMAHVVLPTSNGKGDSNPGKYADMVVPFILKEMSKAGGLRYSTIIKLVGGAQVSNAPGLETIFKTGERNVAQLKESLQKEKMLVAGMDVGGSQGRTVRMYVDTGKVVVKTAGQIVKEL